MTRTLVSYSDSTKTIKFLYSYGGKIVPRRSDGKLRYVGGLTRVLSVPCSISFAELMVKLGELCGSSMSLKCKLPNEDLDVLISITSDEDLKNLIDEYDRFWASTRKDEKIVAVLFPIKSPKKITPVSSTEDLCSSGSSRSASPLTAARATRHRPCESGMVYGHSHRCPGRFRPRHFCFIPSSYYCR